MAEWPTRGQKSPNYWDDDLKAYVDESDRLIVVSGGVIDLDNTKPDGYLIGYKVTGACLIEGTSFPPGSYVFERDSTVYGGWTYRTLDEGIGVVPPPDAVAPVAGTLASSAITETGATVTVSGASDAVALHATPYSFSKDNGSTWTSYQSSNVYAWTGLTPATGHQMRHRVRDAAGNVTTGTAITVTTATPSGWNVWDSIDFATAVDGTYSTSKDFTTTQGRTLTATTANANGIVVTADRLSAVQSGSPVNFSIPGVTTPVHQRTTYDYVLTGTNPSYAPEVRMTINVTVGSMSITQAFNWSAGSGYRLGVSVSAGSGVTWTAGSGYTYSGGYVTGTPGSGLLVVEQSGQVITIKINGTLILTGDFTAHMNGGSANPLIGSFANGRIDHNAGIKTILWEQYV